MSLDMMASERVCYVQCNLCNTILAVSVPCSSLFTIVTVRCGHCANLLSVNMGTSMPTMAPQDHPQSQNNKQIIVSSEGSGKEYGSSSSKSNKNKHATVEPVKHDQPIRTPPIRRLQRKDNGFHLHITGRKFKGLKLWAHFPHIHFGLKLDGTNNKQAKLDKTIAGDHHQGTQKTNGFY
ncbi:hypothetical protein G4B88_002969 [Cannabis sativa]|uniref:YABBY N-terminal domain-containing protein n=1 Tax=Cannabis sativa TaxID=3483 RepID=A0A7J6FMR7_CANSA|nr:hypothetical protein G4B88_002969 [Cannabis sativa]